MYLVPRFVNKIGWLRQSSMLRLSLLLSLVFAVGFAIAIFVALGLGQREIEQRIDTTLSSLASTANIDDFTGDTSDMILRARDELGGLPAPFARAVLRGGGTVDLERNYKGADIWRVFTSRDADGRAIMIAVPLEQSEDARELLSGFLWTTAGIVIVGSLAIGLGAGLMAQRRLMRINGALGRLASGDLTARTGNRRGRDDIDHIASQLDETAGNLERLVTQTRHLSASIAHDLRTPLARLRAQLEMLPDGDQRGAALEEAERLSGIFDTIMRVARIEAGHGRDGFSAISLQNLATDLAEIFGPVIEDADKRLLVDISDGATIDGDRGMLIQALANLIQNAIVHGGDDITIFAKGTKVGVFDNGQGVDPEKFSEIVKPMVRLDAARTTDGSGLGLALVRAVADRHGAQLELGTNTPHGLVATLNFAKL